MRQFLIIVAAALLASPFLSRAANPPKEDEGFVTIFDGKTMNGWKVAGNPDTFKIIDGAFVTKGKTAHCFYVGDEKPFVNFELKVDVMTRAKANGGVYFHTKFQDTGFPRAGFECQVNETHSDPKKTGSLYNIKNVMNTSPVKDDEWWEYDIMVKGKTVTLKVNGKVTVEWTQPDDARKKLSEGTFALQAHDPGSEVHYKNIRVKRLD
ncbi:MAG TPA: DUF1080 domain-containing protein [Tepidisphaeraceae bacterium]